jgi:hypothetical protein
LQPQPDGGEKSPLAIRTDSKKFQLVGHGFEPVLGGNPFLNFLREAFFNLHDFRTFRADQMMVMAVIILADKFEPRRAVAEIKPLHHSHFLQQVHRAVNRGQVTPASGHFGKNLPVCERMRMAPQNFQDGRARAGDFSRLTPQPSGQRGHLLPFVRMWVDAASHGASKIAPGISEIK